MILTGFARFFYLGSFFFFFLGFAWMFPFQFFGDIAKPNPVVSVGNATSTEREADS